MPTSEFDIEAAMRLGSVEMDGKEWEIMAMAFDPALPPGTPPCTFAPTTIIALVDGAGETKFIAIRLNRERFAP